MQRPSITQSKAIRFSNNFGRLKGSREKKTRTCHQFINGCDCKHATWLSLACHRQLILCQGILSIYDPKMADTNKNGASTPCVRPSELQTKTNGAKGVKNSPKEMITWASQDETLWKRGRRSNGCGCGCQCLPLNIQNDDWFFFSCALGCQTGFFEDGEFVSVWVAAEPCRQHLAAGFWW